MARGRPPGDGPRHSSRRQRRDCKRARAGLALSGTTDAVAPPMERSPWPAPLGPRRRSGNDQQHRGNGRRGRSGPDKARGQAEVDDPAQGPDHAADQPGGRAGRGGDRGQVRLPAPSVRPGSATPPAPICTPGGRRGALPTCWSSARTPGTGRRRPRPSSSAALGHRRRANAAISIKIVHVDPQTGRSITRSPSPVTSFVDLSGVPASSGVSTKNKINAAFATPGPSPTSAPVGDQGPTDWSRRSRTPSASRSATGSWSTSSA